MILAELPNWQECRTAVLEYGNDSIYLYSHPHFDNLELKSLWVANTKKRLFSKSDIYADMEKGTQPYMPKKHCTNAAYIRDYENEDNWSLQWGLDQNSIAVFFKGQIVAIMPEWSGVKGFKGYSVGTDSETQLAWPLLSDNIQIERFLKEKNFLDSWSDSMWVDHQEKVLETYKSMYEGETNYYAADGGKWPPLAVHYCKATDREFLATIGMAQLPMPEFGMPFDKPEGFRHIELAIACKPTPDFKPLAKYLSAQAKYPWYHGSHFDHGHTIPCAQLQEIGSKASFMAIVETASFLPKVSMPSYQDRPVRLLYMLPIYKSEQRFAEERSTDELLEKIESESVDPFDIKREAIV